MEFDHYKSWKAISFTIGGFGVSVGSTDNEPFEELERIMDKYIREGKEFVKILPLSILGNKSEDESYG